MNSAHDRAQWRRWEEQHAPDVVVGKYQGVIRDFGNGRVEVRVQGANWWRITKDVRALRDMGAVCAVAKVKEETTEEEKARKAEASLARAVRRAKQRVRWLVAAIEADHLLTLNYRENVQDIERVRQDWAKFVRKVTAAKPEWPYVAVRERQERGAWHLHVAVKGRQDIGLLRRCWYEVVGDAQGQIDVQGPKRRWGKGGVSWSSKRLSAYMVKYMSKDLGALAEAEKKRYWARKGIEVPEVRVWLAATNFVEAIEETYRLARGAGANQTDIWASDLFGVVWIAGTG